jgi:hypothetical protein
MYILFAAVLPPPKGVSKLVFGDGLQFPITAQLEALLGQQGARSDFVLGKKDAGLRRRLGGWGVIPVQNPVLRPQHQTYPVWK